MESCKYYGKCEDVLSDLDELKKGDVLQEASMKSLHKRMDTILIEYKETKEVVSELHESLVSHMSWEEAQAKTREAEEKKNKERKDKNFKIAMFVAGLIFTAASSFTVYMFNSMNTNGDSIVKIEEYHKNNDNRIDDIGESLKDINRFLRGTK